MKKYDKPILEISFLVAADILNGSPQSDTQNDYLDIDSLS